MGSNFRFHFSFRQNIRRFEAVVKFMSLPVTFLLILMNVQLDCNRLQANLDCATQLMVTNVIPYVLQRKPLHFTPGKLKIAMKYKGQK